MPLGYASAYLTCSRWRVGRFSVGHEHCQVVVVGLRRLAGNIVTSRTRRAVAAAGGDGPGNDIWMRDADLDIRSIGVCLP